MTAQNSWQLGCPRPSDSPKCQSLSADLDRELVAVDRGLGWTGDVREQVSRPIDGPGPGALTATGHGRVQSSVRCKRLRQDWVVPRAADGLRQRALIVLGFSRQWRCRLRDFG